MITYKIKPMLNFPLNWCTEITHIKEMEYFVDEQRSGPYKIWHHEHHFKAVDNGTIVIDILEFGLPKDIIGKVFGKVYFNKYLEELLKKRTDLVRTYAETEKWRAVLS
jgi:ligand-binding SRPBCC domain-containing protein